MDKRVKQNLEEMVDRFKEHDEQAQELYDQYKPVFDLTVARIKNSLTINQSLRDISEVAKSLSSIRADAMNASKHRFDSYFKLTKLEMDESKASKDAEGANNAAAIMRQLTEAINNNGLSNKSNTNNDIQQIDSNKLLDDRIRESLSSGDIKLNVNEEYMKYDYNGVIYKYSTSNNSTVAIDNSGNIIDGYPQNRIPDAYKFKTFDTSGNPISMTGTIIERID